MTPSTKLRDGLYRDLLEVCDSPAYALDGQGTFLYAHPALCNMTGYSRAELAGRSLALLIGKEQLAELLQAFHAEAGDGNWKRPVEVLHKNGASRFGAIITWRHSAVEGGAGIVGSLVQSQPEGTRLGALAGPPHDTPCPEMRITRDGNVIYANDAAHVILEAWGCAVNQSLPGEVCGMIAETYDTGETRQLDLKCSDRVYMLTLVPEARTEVVNVHGIDVTERERMEERLKQAYEGLESRVAERTAEITEANDRLMSEVAERKRIEQELREINQKLKEAQSQLLQSEKLASVGQLAAGVAHEINNPVGYIKSNLGTLNQYVDDLLRVLDIYESMEQLLQADPQAMGQIREVKAQVDMAYLKGDLKDLLTESEEGVERVKRIVQDLKDFSHVDEAEWQWADIHKGLESTLNIVRNEIKYKCEVVKEYGELPSVECIPSQLNQVFTNLLVNASQAIEDSGVITIRTGFREAQGEIWIEIADTGQGIAPGDLKRIFDPFFTTKPVGKGTGLGLSLSYGIIKSHHGRIEVSSTPGEGTIFKIWLPVAQSEAQADREDAGRVIVESAFED